MPEGQATVRAAETQRVGDRRPDALGAGKSTKPSDGMRATFPRYNYDDMVLAQYRLVTEHLGIKRLRLVMGNSMGGMHACGQGGVDIRVGGDDRSPRAETGHSRNLRCSAWETAREDRHCGNASGDGPELSTG